MKKLSLFLLIVTFLACSSNDEPNKTARRKANISQTTMLKFESAEQADNFLSNLQSLNPEEKAKEIEQLPISNKYLRSIIIYDNLYNSVSKNHEDNEFLEYCLKRDEKYLYIDEKKRTIEPLSNYDYRCLINEEGMFSIADTIYHFHDSVFIKVPHTYLEKYYTLLDKYGNEKVVHLVCNDEVYGDDDIFDLDYIYTGDHYVTDINYYEADVIAGKERIFASVYSDEKFHWPYKRHDLTIGIQIKNYHHWLWWWIVSRDVTYDITIEGQFWSEHYDQEIDMFGHWTNHQKKTSIKEHKTDSYPYTDLEITKHGIKIQKATINNGNISINENDFK